MGHHYEVATNAHYDKSITHPHMALDVARMQNINKQVKQLCTFPVHKANINQADTEGEKRRVSVCAGRKAFLGTPTGPGD